VFVHQQWGAAAQFGEQAEDDKADKGRERIARRAAMRRGRRQLHCLGKGHRIDRQRNQRPDDGPYPAKGGPAEPVRELPSQHRQDQFAVAPPDSQRRQGAPAALRRSSARAGLANMPIFRPCRCNPAFGRVMVSLIEPVGEPC